MSARAEFRRHLGRVQAWLRGPHVPICVIAVIFALNYITFGTLGRWRPIAGWQRYAAFAFDTITLRNVDITRWPISSWQMYARRAPITPVVGYRRVVAHYADGRAEPTDLGDQVAFLKKQYRLDYGLSRDLAAFLIACLREARRSSAGMTVVGFTFETRSWWYERTTLAEHLAHEPPDVAYRVVALTGPRGLPTLPSGGTNPLVNGRFNETMASSGAPLGWVADNERWLGLGVDLATGNRAVLLPRFPDGAMRSLRQTVTVDPTGAETTLRAAVVVYAPTGAFLQLQIAQPGGEPVIGSRDARPATSWQRLELTHVLPFGAGPTDVTVALFSSGETFVASADLSLVGGGPH